MGYDPYPLLGIETAYADGRTMLLGSRHGCQLSFTIGGSGGERITEISAMNRNTSYIRTKVVTHGLCGLEVCCVGFPTHTNTGLIMPDHN